MLAACWNAFWALRELSELLCKTDAQAIWAAIAGLPKIRSAEHQLGAHRFCAAR